MERHSYRDKRSVKTRFGLLELFSLSILSERFGFGMAKKTEDHYRNLLFGCKDQRGQSTVEYALIMAGMLAIVIVIGILSSAVQSNLFIEHAVFSASHNVSSAIGAIVDVFMY